MSLNTCHVQGQYSPITETYNCLCFIYTLSTASRKTRQKKWKHYWTLAKTMLWAISLHLWFWYLLVSTVCECITCLWYTSKTSNISQKAPTPSMWMNIEQNVHFHKIPNKKKTMDCIWIIHLLFNRYPSSLLQQGWIQTGTMVMHPD